MDRQLNPCLGEVILVPGHPFPRAVPRADDEAMDAPLGSVELEEAEELQRLRRRAYGPDADIAADAAAQARLSELEAAQRRQLTPVVDAAAGVAAPVPERGPVPEPVEGPRPAPTSVPHPVDRAFAEQGSVGGAVTEQDRAEESIADSDPIDAAHAAPWWRRRRFALLGGAIAALALNVAVVAWMSQLLANGSTPIPAETSTAKMPPLRDGDYVPAPDYVLALKSVGDDADAPNDRHGTLNSLGISADELRRYEDFQGLNVWSGESRDGMTCLLVAVPVQGLREGYSAEGCSPEGLGIIADLPPRGSDGLTQLVLWGDHVDVYVYVRAADPNASQG